MWSPLVFAFFLSGVSAISQSYYPGVDGSGSGAPPESEHDTGIRSVIKEYLALCLKSPIDSGPSTPAPVLTLGLTDAKHVIAECVREHPQLRVLPALLNLVHWNEKEDAVPELCHNETATDSGADIAIIMRTAPICPLLEMMARYSCAAQEKKYCGPPGGEQAMSEKLYAATYIALQIMRNHSEAFECDNVPHLNPALYSVDFDSTELVAGGLNCSQLLDVSPQTTTTTESPLKYYANLNIGYQISKAVGYQKYYY